MVRKSVGGGDAAGPLAFAPGVEDGPWPWPPVREVSDHRHCVMCGLGVVVGEEGVLVRRMSGGGGVTFPQTLCLCRECKKLDHARLIVASSSAVLTS